MDVRYESMYSGKQNGESMPGSQYEQLKVRKLGLQDVAYIMQMMQ